MISEDVLREALIMAYDQEADALERQAAQEGLHSFSETYRARMQHIAYMAKRRYVTVMHKRRRLVLVVAAIVIMMIAAAVTTLAIVRPQIFYHITKGIGSWDYTFKQEDPNKVAGGFEYIKPTAPKGYEIKEENKNKEFLSYDVYYENKNGKFIHYDQEDISEGYTMSMTDTSKQESININGNEATLFFEDDTYTILWNDGYYVYSLYGSCKKEELIKMATSIKR